MTMRARSVTMMIACVLGSATTMGTSAGQVGAAPAGLPMAPPSTPPPGSEGGVPGIELVPGLGGAGQPDGVPREIVIAGERFLFDRVVPLSRQQLVRVAQEQETIAYAVTEQGPFAAVYLSVPSRSEDELARFLPEQATSPDVACPAEAGNFERVDAEGSLYAFAGVETDLTADTLQQVGESDGRLLYADVDAAQPFPELFIGADEGLLRFVLVGADGRPASLATSLAFAGTEFAFDSDVTDVVDPASFTKLGCATSFPVYTGGDATGTELFVLVGTRWLRFTGAGTAPANTSLPETTATPTTTAPATTTTLAPTTTTTTTLPPTTTLAPTTSTTTTTTLAPTTTTLPPTTTTIPPTTSTTTTTTLAPTTTTSTTTTLPAATTTSTSTSTTSTSTLAPAASTSTSTTPTTTTEVAVTTSTSTTEPTTSTTTAEAAATSTSTTAAGVTTTTAAPADTTTTSTTTAVIQPPAVVATLPPDAPAPAATNASPAACVGDPGERDSRDLPRHLPSRIQIGGVAYVFAGTDDAAAAGTLSRIRCVGPFEAVSSDEADAAEVLYLRSNLPGSDEVYRFEAVVTFEIQFQITDEAQVLAAGDETFRLGPTWQPAVYSSTTVILFVEDPEEPSPDTVYAVDVSQSPVGDVIAEYRLVAEAEAASADLQDLAGNAGLNADLTINGVQYTLVEIYTPAGTTSNGFITLFGAAGGSTDFLLGRDQRERGLFVFLADASTA